MIGIIDYGMGNLGSVVKGFERVGAEARVLTDYREVKTVDRLVLPGVGAFADAARTLRAKNFVGPILDFVAGGRPFWGFVRCSCFSMSVTRTAEHTGLGIIAGEGRSIRFFRRYRLRRSSRFAHGVEHAELEAAVPMLEGLKQNCSVYFVIRIMWFPTTRPFARP